MPLEGILQVLFNQRGAGAVLLTWWNGLPGNGILYYRTNQI